MLPTIFRDGRSITSISCPSIPGFPSPELPYRDKGSASIRGDGNFMTMNSGGLLCYGRNLSRRHRIYDAQIAVALVDYQQRLSTDARWDQSKTKSWEQ